MKATEQIVCREGKIKEVTPSPTRKAGEKENNLLNVHLGAERQKIIGFGGAVTESSAYNYAQLSDEEKKKALEFLFGETGLKYNVCRLCIGSSDFALAPYSYVKNGDRTLSSFSVEHDRAYVIPFLKDAMAHAKMPLLLFASPWSPPAFMKENHSLVLGGKLKKSCYSLYAEYLVKFVEAYREEGIEISALTPQNEPHATQTWESCVFTAEEEAEFLNVLYETLRNHGLNTKLIFWDHNKERLLERAQKIYGICGDAVWGIGFHWYSGAHFGEIEAVRALYPEKAIVETEFCCGIGPSQNTYASEILGNLSAGTNAIVEWNLLLNRDGGPYHNRFSGCNSPLCFRQDTGEVLPSNLYAETYAFSHFIQRGAVALYTSSYTRDIDLFAVRNPDGTVLVILLNLSTEKKEAFVKLIAEDEASETPVTLAGHDLTVLKFETQRQHRWWA